MGSGSLLPFLAAARWPFDGEGAGVGMDTTTDRCFRISKGKRHVEAGMMPAEPRSDLLGPRAIPCP